VKRIVPRPPKRLPAAAQLHWHEAECGAYAADLPLWGDLAGETKGPVLELGCGAGRVLMHLGRRGHEAWGVDSDPELIAAAQRKAREAHLQVEVRRGDVRNLHLERRFGLCIAPMQFLQLLPGPTARMAALRVVADHLEPGGLAASTVVENARDGEVPPGTVPDLREVGGWVYSSLPIGLRQRGPRLEIERLREAVSPSGRHHRESHVERLTLLSADQVEGEALEAGLAPYDRRYVPAEDAWRDATAVILRREA